MRGIIGMNSYKVRFRVLKPVPNGMRVSVSSIDIWIEALDDDAVRGEIDRIVRGYNKSHRSTKYDFDTIVASIQGKGLQDLGQGER